MQLDWWILLLTGAGIGTAAAFTGLGGGFLVVPLLLWAGFSGSRSVGTSTLAILIMILSAVIAHHRLGNIDYRTGLLLGLGGMAGAQFGAQLIQHVSTGMFRKIFASVLVLLAIYLFVKK